MPSLTTEMEQVAKRFEEAVRKQEQFLSDINHYGESELTYVETGNEYKAAKEELLKCLSWVP